MKHQTSSVFSCECMFAHASLCGCFLAKNYPLLPGSIAGVSSVLAQAYGTRKFLDRRTDAHNEWTYSFVWGNNNVDKIRKDLRNSPVEIHDDASP